MPATTRSTTTRRRPLNLATAPLEEITDRIWVLNKEWSEALDSPEAKTADVNALSEQISLLQAIVEVRKAGYKLSK